MLGSRQGATNQYTPQYAASVEKRKKELYQEPFSTSEDAALKARYFDSLSASRDDRAQQMAQMLAQRGFANTSGLAGDAMGQVEASYQTDRAQQQQQLMQYVMDKREERRNLAVQMAGGLADQGYHDATLAAQNLSARGNMAGALASLAQAQQNAQLAAAGGIGGLRQQDFANRQGLYDQSAADLDAALLAAEPAAPEPDLDAGRDSQRHARCEQRHAVAEPAAAIQRAAEPGDVAGHRRRGTGLPVGWAAAAEQLRGGGSGLRPALRPWAAGEHGWTDSVVR